MHDVDEYIQSQLLLAALSITTHVLGADGTFVAKIFRGKDTNLLYDQLRIFFKKVTITKPASSRLSSIEAFVVCQNYCPPEGYIPQMIDAMNTDVCIASEPLSRVNRRIVPFIACGDLRGYDADMSYSLNLVGVVVDSMCIIFYNKFLYCSPHQLNHIRIVNLFRNPSHLPIMRSFR